MSMRLPSWLKRAVLGAAERAGYVVLTRQGFAQLQDTIIALRYAVPSYGNEGQRPGEEAQRPGGELLGAPPPIDYQVLMDFQAKLYKFEDADPGFFALYERVKPYTMTSIERLYAMHKAVEYVVRADIQGAIVECGVWRGGSMMMAALTLLALGKTDRSLFLFDTFAGHPRPSPEHDGKETYEFWWQRRRTDQSSSWAEATLQEVRGNLASAGYPLDKITFVQGIVQDTIPAHAPETVALLRLDTDWYESTAHELRHLYPRLVAGGVLIIDDYGAMAGQRQAVDEFCARNAIALLLNRIDFSGRVAVKPVNSVTSPFRPIEK
jgi:O-methyltransferase